MVRKFLTVDPKKRLTAKDAMAHQWMKNNNMAKLDLQPLKKYQASRKLKKAAKKLMALQKLQLAVAAK